MSMNHTATPEWHRLSARIIWVDLAQIIVTQLPLFVAILIMDGTPNTGQLWPLIALAGFGLLGAIADAIRWVVTRYRVTATYVELKTGVIFRRHRSIQRDRIRSIDTEAKLRHRVAGLRLVKIGAGQQSSADESALELDALSAADAQTLRQRLLTAEIRHKMSAEDGAADIAVDDPDDTTQPTPLQVFARFRPGWVVYNVFNIWAYAVAMGLVGAAWWLVTTLDIDPTGWIVGLLDWQSIGWVGTTVIALLAVGIVGVLGMAVSYFTEFWKFELSRVQGPESTELRTTQGLFTTREVNRDENRIRGFQISQPLFWRWMRVTDTLVITTGLSLTSMSQPAAILPRVPLPVAHSVVAQIIAPEANPFDVPLTGHPRAALRRRLWWATVTTLFIGVVLVVLVSEAILKVEIFWGLGVFWLLALAGAVIAYRALGHTITGRYLVVRSGLMNRATYALHRSAVSTIVVKESIFQRRLGVRTVSAMSAAGYGIYEAPDVAARDSLSLAVQAAPGVLDEFIIEAEA